METSAPSPAVTLGRLFDTVWNAGDLDAADALFAHPAPARAFIAQFRAGFPDIAHRIQEALVEGERVAVRWRAEGTHQGAWAGIAPTRRAVAFTGMTMALVRDGKIQEHVTEWDRAGLLEQLR